MPIRIYGPKLPKLRPVNSDRHLWIGLTRNRFVCRGKRGRGIRLRPLSRIFGQEELSPFGWGIFFGGPHKLFAIAITKPVSPHSGSCLYPVAGGNLVSVLTRD